MSAPRWNFNHVKETIKREISWVITNKINDPRIPEIVTIREIKLSPDKKDATVYASFNIEPDLRDEAIASLNRASPFIQRCIAPKIRIKNIPRLVFIYDDTFARAEKIDSILEQIDNETQ